MREIKLKVKGTPDYDAALSASREAAANEFGRTPSLVAWYDFGHRVGGPLELCVGEVESCARTYASNHGGDICVTVNKDNFEFFFAAGAGDELEFDHDTLLSVHPPTLTHEYDNMQGG